MYAYANETSYDFVGYELQKYNYDEKGKQVGNPRLFKTKKGKNKGLSIRVKKVFGRGKFEYLEIACYNQALAEAKALDLKPFELISFYGYYEVVHGEKKDFHNITINETLQIERYTREPAKALEI